MIYEFGKGIREAKKAHIMKGYTNLDIQKGGEGSKGGKIIGHTKSGKAIYDTFSHPAHKDFNEEDHRNAVTAHGKAGETRYKIKLGPNSEGKEERKKDIKHHLDEGAKHYKAKAKLSGEPTYGNGSVEKSESMKVDKKEIIDEHKKLVGVLESPSHEDDKKEAKKQKKELEGYEEDVNKSEFTDLQKAYEILGIKI